MTLKVRLMEPLYMNVHGLLEKQPFYLLDMIVKSRVY